jgi:hypothetical protein
VMAAQGFTTVDGLGCTIYNPVCPQGSFPFTRHLDDEDGGGNTNHALNDRNQLFPHASFGNSASSKFGVGAIGDSCRPNGGSIVHFCYVPPSNDPTTPELPDSLWVWNMNTRGWDFRNMSRDFMFLAKGAQLNGEFHQDNEDSNNRNRWVIPPGSVPFEWSMKDIIAGTNNTAWRFGWTGINPGIGELPEGQAAPQPSCLDPFASLECAGKWASFAAKVWAAF